MPLRADFDGGARVMRFHYSLAASAGYKEDMMHSGQRSLALFHAVDRCATRGDDVKD